MSIVIVRPQNTSTIRHPEMLGASAAMIRADSKAKAKQQTTKEVA